MSRESFLFRFVFLVFLGLSQVFGCSGNCFACHADLEKNIVSDSKHKVILECINCHKDLNVQQMSGDDACAGDCFVCHSPKKLTESQIPAHRDINKCRECHLKKYDLIGQEEQNPFNGGMQKIEQGFLYNQVN